MKKIKTSSNQIKESRKYLPKTALESKLLKDEFEIVYDIEYQKNHTLYGKVEVYSESIVKNKTTQKNEVVSELVWSGNRVVTSNVKRELSRASVLFKPLLKSKSPGKIMISNCNDSGPARIPDEFLD